MSPKSSADDVALILDDGPTPLGLESTVLDLSGEAPALLRPGAVTFEALTELLGPIALPGFGPPKSPGMLASHYAPRLPVRLDRNRCPSRRGLARLRP